jgi:hypothetical protein
MDWQLPLVILCTVLAALYVAQRTWRTWSGRGGSCGGCKCNSTPPAASGAKPLISRDELTSRLRRPQN